MMERRSDKLPESSCVPFRESTILLVPLCATAWIPRRTGLSGSAGSSVSIPRAGKQVQTATKPVVLGSWDQPVCTLLSLQLWVMDSLPYGTSSGTSVSPSG